MATERTVITDAYVEVDGTELSNQGNKIVLKREKEVMDATGFRAKAKQKEGGIPDASMDITLFQGYKKGGVNSVLSSIWDEDKEVKVVIKWKKGKASEENPKYVMTGKLFTFPLEGSVNSIQTVECTFENTGESGIQELTTSEEGEKE